MKDMQRNRIKEIVVIILYLSAIVIANNIIATYGITALYITSFFIIPFDLFSRDILHEKWHTDPISLVIKMLVLISVGSLLSFVLNQDTKQIALASFCGFLSAGIVNLVLYELFWEQPKWFKMNISNFVAAIIDSIVFITIAFSFDLIEICTQSLVKFFGAMFWVVIYLNFLTSARN